MIFRVLALVFLGAALVTGVSLGWDTVLGDALRRMNPRMMSSMQSGVESYLMRDLWAGVFEPIFSIPAWSGWVALAVIFFIVSALQPGRV